MRNYAQAYIEALAKGLVLVFVQEHFKAGGSIMIRLVIVNTYKQL